MAHAERIGETFERYLAPSRDGLEQIAHRDFGKTLLLLELDGGVAGFEGEDVGRLLDPALLEEQRDLLLAQALDIEGAARHEVAQMLDLLMRARELAAEAGARALLAPGDRLAHHRGLERTRAGLGKPVGLGAARLVLDHAQHLRDDVAGALDRDRIADPHAEPLDL